MTNPDGRKRVVVVVNKWWECDPVMFVLTSDYVRPACNLGWPKLLQYPCPHRDCSKTPRAIFRMDKITAEIWCISDLLAGYPDNACHQSSSEIKMIELPHIFNYPADLVIAVGTAASYPTDVSNNGSVIIGTKVFMHNSHPKGENPCSNWQVGPFDEMVESSLTKDRFTQIVSNLCCIPKLFLVARNNPAEELGIVPDYDYVALNSINVTDYSEYEAKDNETLCAYHQHCSDDNRRSLETTHGLIRVAAGENAPFLFVSGIVDRVGHFDDDVSDTPCSQNTVGAYNAGVTVGLGAGQHRHSVRFVKGAT